MTTASLDRPGGVGRGRTPKWRTAVAAVGGLALAGAALAPAAGATPAGPGAATTGAAVAPGAPPIVGYHTQSVSIPVTVGPDGSTHCTVVGEVFIPDDAGPGHQVSSILTTNGFGGSYADQTALAGFFAGRDYEVLTYSGLGFGGSGCNIELDSPAYDGRAASQLVSWLGVAPRSSLTVRATPGWE